MRETRCVANFRGIYTARLQLAPRSNLSFTETASTSHPASSNALSILGRSRAASRHDISRLLSVPCLSPLCSRVG